ncbi:hypothetical protein ABGV42_00745 [Paenibacillus pabuli]|uniref:hypothetical protein n=1 Tax=Paenibacillus pabuli TaxID=1472 RepID=UPI003242DA04
MHKIIDRFNIYPGGSNTSMNKDNEIYYTAKIGQEPPPDWDVHHYLGGSVSSFMTQELDITSEVVIFDNQCIRVTPVAPIEFSEIIEGTSNSIIGHLYSRGMAEHLIDNILVDLKFNYGYHSNKYEDCVLLTSSGSSLRLEYNDYTKFDMTKIVDHPGFITQYFEQNYGGTQTLQHILGTTSLKLDQDMTDPLRTVITLNDFSESIRLNSNKVEFRLNNLDWLADVESIFEMLGVAADYSKRPYKEELDLLFVGRFVIDTISNVAAHNYRDYSRVHVVKFEGIDFPFVVPQGYTEGLDI